MESFKIPLIYDARRFPPYGGCAYEGSCILICIFDFDLLYLVLSALGVAIFPFSKIAERGKGKKQIRGTTVQYEGRRESDQDTKTPRQ